MAPTLCGFAARARALKLGGQPLNRSTLAWTRLDATNNRFASKNHRFDSAVGIHLTSNCWF
jgi:hypothetical protein